MKNNNLPARSFIVNIMLRDGGTWVPGDHIVRATTRKSAIETVRNWMRNAFPGHQLKVKSVLSNPTQD